MDLASFLSSAAFNTILFAFGLIFLARWF